MRCNLSARSSEAADKVGLVEARYIQTTAQDFFYQIRSEVPLSMNRTVTNLKVDSVYFEAASALDTICAHWNHKSQRWHL